MRIQTLARSLVTTTGLALILLATPAQAQLVNYGDLVSAEDSAGNPNQLTVTNPDAGTANISVLAPVVVSNWNQFNVPVNTTLNISNASAAAQASLLARVIGGGFSDMSGTINASGINLWLINQNGILFGNKSSVNASSFFASTLALTDADFFDFYEGTDIAGNGSSSVHFATNPYATTFIGAAAGAKFTTNGHLMFLSPALELNAQFDAGTGTASFIAATQAVVGMTPGSPLTFSLPAGTTVATQSIAGSVTGHAANFAYLTAAGATNALLSIDANVAATAAAGATGIQLYAGGSVAPNVAVNGAMSTTGRIQANVDGDLTIAPAVTSSAMTLNVGGALTADDLTATTGLATFNAASIDAGDVSGAGGISFQADNAKSATFDSLVSSGGAILVSGFVPGAITVNGATSGKSVQLISVGALKTGAVTSTGGVASLNALSGSVTTGDVSATGGNAIIVARDAVTAASISSTAAVDVDSMSGGNLQLGNLNAGTTIALDTAGGVTAGSATAGSALNVGASAVPVGVNFSGPVLAGSFSARTAGALSFSGVNQIQNITGIATGAALSVNNAVGNLTISGIISNGGNDVTIVNTGDVTLTSTGRVIGGGVALSAGDQFINNRGADAIAAANRWIVYSAAPTGNTFGGLNSGNTAIWNATFATRAPGTITGNSYVFAYQPTLTVTTTDASKVYGTDLTGALGGNYTISGLQTGVANAYLGDTMGSVLSGTPTISSTGAAANADVSGSPYVIAASTSGMTASSGYALAVDNAGRLTITPKAISAVVGADDKTYDGTTAATGTLTLTGVLAGDSVGTSGTAFAFTDKNAGTDKAVIVSGTLLTGADAGNYTLNVPASVLADIVAKAISGTASADDKTYDGTTAATGTVTLSGVAAGDTVGTEGTVFAFNDKNAGTDKTVMVSGTTLTGADAGNYVLTVPATTIADIFAKAITATVAANSKTYDGSTAATGTVNLQGVVSGDEVTATGSSFAFADKNAGANKTVTVTGTVLSGADAGNYTLAIPATTLASIFAKAITATVSADSKTYDGTTAGSGTVALSGVVAGDAVGTAGTTFTFADKNAGENKTVMVTGTALTGADAGNYTLSIPTSTLASILQRALLIVANDATKLAGDPDPALTYMVGGAGLVGGDVLSGALAREAGDEVGDYAINQGSLTAGGNYAIAFTPGTLTIERNAVADAALAGQNSLRALPLPSEGGRARASGVLVIAADSLCPADDHACRGN